MTNYPSESSLVVNATQQQLSQSPFTAGVAIAPSQREEAEGGYDIAFETASRLELQYKAVYSEIGDRMFRRGLTLDAAKFPFDGSQAKSLLARQTGPGTAFYALPVVTDVSGLGDVLGATVFLDVVGLWNLPKAPGDLQEYTAFWVPVNNGTPTFSEVYLKDGGVSRYSRPRAYDRVEGQYLYTWSEIKRLTGATMIGVPIRTDGETQTTAGYLDLVSFERQLLHSKLRELTLDDPRSEETEEWDLISAVSSEIGLRNIQVGETVAQTRPERTELPSEVRELLNNHRYLLDPKFDIERQQKAVEAALVSGSDEEGIEIDYAGLDPRQGSRHRQYRFLTSGEQTDEVLTVPIGFA
ncbi:hypothetical protein [Halovivax cerinus]|uniref:Uncharacterized protein n=1 Tax=Halovivax cerinus TaxID=1487865 RepID=A0ABD5NKV8_9EURY|nr:hypothetical protein [Halovivax cerinus]